MFFDDFKSHKDAKLDPRLFWEYRVKEMEFKNHIDLVVQRVIERGMLEDFYAMFHLFPKKDIVEAIKKIHTMTSGNIEFVSRVFEIPKEEMAAYQRMLKYPTLWPHNQKTT